MELMSIVAIMVFYFLTLDVSTSFYQITNVTLVDGDRPSEGRVELVASRFSDEWFPVRSRNFDYLEASLICRELGYPAVNNPNEGLNFGSTLPIYYSYIWRIICFGGESLSECEVYDDRYIYEAAGVICYEEGYIGCYRFNSSEFTELQTPCGIRYNDVQNLTIQNCITWCHRSGNTYAYTYAMYAGVYKGDTCLCGDASLAIDQSASFQESSCNTPCTGRNIEYCGGSSHIALFNISMVSVETTSTRQTTSGSITTSTQQTVSDTHNSTEIVVTNGYSTSSLETSTTSKIDECNQTCQMAEVQYSQGGQVGLTIVVVILLLYAMVVTIFTILLFRQRRKGMTAETECKGPDPYMDLQPRPEDEGGRTYQEMATISKTLSNTPEDGSLPQEPTDSAVYENQAAAMYHEYDEDKTNEGGTYETVSSPIRRNQNSYVYSG